jgi:cardiolipin synthase
MEDASLASVPSPMTADRARDVVASIIGGRPHRKALALDLAPATATSWELLIDGQAFFPRMLADIEAARSDVHIIIFGFRPGRIGDSFRDLLVRKVRDGVAVRLVTDGAYSQPGLGSRHLYRALRAGGVEVVVNQGAFLDLDGPLGHRRIDWRFDDLGHFDHRKAVIVDGRTAFVGGPGIEDHYADDTFHDVMVRVEGPVVAQLQAVFLLSWWFQGGPLATVPGALDRFFPAPASTDGIAVDVLHNVPGAHHLPIAAAYHAAIRGAGRRLYLINPYLTDHSVIRDLRDARLRGVDVRVIVPADPLSFIVRGAERHWFPMLAQAGVEVREYPRMAHAKVMVADDTVLAGSANLDALSLRRNWEMTLRATDAALAEHVVRELFERDLGASGPARAASGRRSRWLDAMMSALSPLF